MRLLWAAAVVASFAGLAPRVSGLTCAPTPAPTCADPHTCGLHCVGADAYDKYLAPPSVETNKPDAAFPTKSGEEMTYAESAATPVIVMVALALVCFVTCCCYNCCNCCGRIDKRNGLVSCHPAQCWAAPKCRLAAWAGLAATSALYLAVLSVGLSANGDTANGIRGLPSVMTSAANYLEDPLLTSLGCTALYASDVASAAQAMQTSTAMTECSTTGGHPAALCNAINASLVVVVESAYRIQDQINGTKNSSAYNMYTGGNSSATDGILTLLNDGLSELRSAASDANDYADTAGDYFEQATTILLAVLLGVGFLALCVSSLAGVSDDWKGRSCVTSTCLNLMVLLFLMLALIGAVYVLLLRLSAGFCADPFVIAAETMQQKNDTAAGYYINCHTLTDAERNSTWPWESERAQVSTSYNDITSLMTGLQGNWTAIGGEASLYSHIDTTVSSMGCAVTGDSGVLGFNGMLKCATLNRFVQEVVISYCDTFLDPLNTLAACLLVLAIAMLVCNWLEVALRREPSYHAKIAPDTSDLMEMKALV